MDVGEVTLVKKYVGEKKHVGETFRYVGEKYVGECRNLNVCWRNMLVKNLCMLVKKK